MKKQQSTSKSNIPLSLQADYDKALENVTKLEADGQFNTYWHRKAARLAAAIETLQGAKTKSEVKDNGSPIK